MSTRRSSSRSMMRSLTPCRPPSGLRGSVTSSQFLNAARWSSPQNFERALSAAQSASVSVKPLSLPVRGAPRQVLRDVEAERRRELLLLDGGEIEIGRRRDAALRQRDAIVDRLHRAGAEHLAGHELGRHDRGGELLEHRLPVASEPEQQVGHEHRHEPRERARNPSVICSMSGSRCHSGSDDSTSVAPSRSPSTVLISCAAAVTIGSSVFEPGG